MLLKRLAAILAPGMNRTGGAAETVVSAVPKVRFAVTLYMLSAAQKVSQGVYKNCGGAGYRPEPRKPLTASLIGLIHMGKAYSDKPEKVYFHQNCHVQPTPKTKELHASNH